MLPPAIKTAPNDSFLSWDLSEMFSGELPEYPLAWSPVSENPPPLGHAKSNSNSNFGSSNSDSYSNSDSANREDPLTDQRKRRRTISNRESARRSRMRKQKRLEDLTSEVDRLKFENAQQSKGFRSAMCHCQRLLSNNEHLRLENSIFRKILRNTMSLALSQHPQTPPPSSSLMI